LQGFGAVHAEEGPSRLTEQAADGCVGFRAGDHADLLLVAIEEGGLFGVLAGGGVLAEFEEAGGAVGVVNGLGGVHPDWGEGGREGGKGGRVSVCAWLCVFV